MHRIVSGSLLSLKNNYVALSLKLVSPTRVLVSASGSWQTTRSGSCSVEVIANTRSQSMERVIQNGAGSHSPATNLRHALTGTLTTASGIEYSVHTCPRAYLSDLASIFPSHKDPSSLLIVPTRQRAGVDLVRTGEQVEEEKDSLLEKFVAWASAICRQLASAGHFADYLDPSSGLPMVHRETNTVYGEVDAMQTLLGYPTANAGCCKVVLHPKWGSSVYPATMFTDAPLEVLLGAVRQADQAA